MLELCVVGRGVGEHQRADLLVDGLAARSGDGPRGCVVCPAVDVTEEMRCGEAELAGLDPRWFEVLDFRALPVRRLRDASSARPQRSVPP